MIAYQNLVTNYFTVKQSSCSIPLCQNQPIGSFAAFRRLVDADAPTFGLVKGFDPRDEIILFLR